MKSAWRMFFALLATLSIATFAWSQGGQGGGGGAGSSGSGGAGSSGSAGTGENSLASGFPGAMAFFTASVRTSSRNPALRLSPSGPWHA